MNFLDKDTAGYVKIGLKNIKRGFSMRTISREPYPPCAVSNVVSYMHLDMKQNQKKVALCAKDKLPLFFDPKIFASSQQQVSLKGYPPAKVLFFSRKSQTIVGGISEDHNRLIAWSIVRYLRKKFNADINLESLNIKNIVAHIYMPFRVNLEAVNKEIPSRTEFKPESIDCCRINSIHGSPKVFLIFSTGSILLVGCKSMEELENVYIEACEIATKHKSYEVPSKSISQKYKRKRNILNEDTIHNTNIEIETAMSMKRRKIMTSNKHEKVKKVNLETIDELFDYNKSASAAYQRLLEDEANDSSKRLIDMDPPFAPSISTYYIEDPKTEHKMIEFNIDDTK